MPHFTGGLKFPSYDGPHEIIEYAETSLLRCIVCDVIVDPLDVPWHLALPEDARVQPDGSIARP